MESVQITELINVCRELGSEKGAERRKAGTKLKNLLNRSSVKKALDKNYELKNSSKNAGKIFTWENVFKAVRIYVDMETEEVKNASENVSKTTLNNRETRKHEASGLFKYVIRSADKGIPKLKGSVVISYIVETLKDPYRCSSYGQDFCSILLKNILSTRKYVAELNSKDWHELLFLFFRLYHDRGTKLDHLLLSRVVHSLISSATQQCDIRAKKVLQFFTEFFKISSQERSVMVLEYMVSALNTFVGVIAPDSRTQICKMGEEIFPNILYLWHNVASEELKEHLIEFLQTQMWAHHPGGHKQDSSAALAVDWDRWLSYLRKLYEILYMEMQQLGTKTRKPVIQGSSILEDMGQPVYQFQMIGHTQVLSLKSQRYIKALNKECVLKPGYVDLAVDVCQQLFSATSDVIEVTQTAGGSGDTQSGPRPKKRRLESGWAAVRDFIATAGQTVKLIPWTQLVTRLVEKYTDSLPNEEIIPYLQTLSNILSDCKRTDLMKYIMCCLESFVRAWDKITLFPTDLVAVQSRPVWEKIWAGTLRFVALHHAEAEGYNLLTLMLEKKLVMPGKEIWSLFVPMITHPVEESVEFLCRYLSIHDLPEKHQTSLFSSLSENIASSTFPLRNQLIDWLIPSIEEESDSQRCVSHLTSDWTADVLVTLTLRNPSSAWFRPEQLPRNFLCCLEETYLNTALVTELTFENLFEKPRSLRGRDDVVHIPVLLKKVEDVLKGQVQYYCNKVEFQICHIEEMCTYCCTLARLIFLLLECNILSATTVTKSSFCDLLTLLMKKMASAVSDFVKTEGIGQLKQVILKLERLFSSLKESRSSDSCCVMAHLIRAMMPAKLVDLVMDIAFEKLTLKSSAPGNQADITLNQSRLNQTSSGGRARLLDDFDDMDIEFDGPSANNNNVEDDLDFDDDLVESQDSDDTLVADGGFHSLLSASCLSESQQLKLEAISFICHWCSFDHPPPVSLTVRCDRDVKYIRSKVIKLLEEDLFDPNRAIDLQMLKSLVCTMTSGSHTLRDEDFLIMLKAVKNVVKLHRRDQEICCTSLDMLMRLSACMEEEEEDTCSKEKQDSRDLLLYLVNAFWKLQAEGNYTSSFRLYLAKFMGQLVRLDPHCKWSKFPGEEEGVGGDSSLTPSYRLVECGADYAHNIRMFVTSALPDLFVCNKHVTGTQTATDRQYQEQMFGQVYEVLTDSLDIQGRLSAEKLQDERSNRVSSVLIGLGTVMSVSPVCEKKAVFAVCQLMKMKNIEKELVLQLLGKVSKVLGYKTSASFIESHLPYLIHEWLFLGYSISEFPYHLLACDSSQHFYRMHLPVLIPELLVNKDLQTIQDIAVSLECDWKEVLRDCVPKILVHILPLFAASRLSETGDDENVKRRTAKATACYDLLIEEISKEVVDKQIVSCLDEIVVNVLMCLYDNDSLEEGIRNLDPEPNPPFFNTYTIITTLDYLNKSFSGTGKSLVEILCKNPDSIQKILLSLSTHLMSSHRIHCKRRLLMMYQLFTRLLLKEFHNQLGGVWAFVMREIIVRLVYLIKEVSDMKNGSFGLEYYVEDITCMTAELLREVCAVTTDVCPQELRKYLPLLSSNLIPLVTVSNSVGEKSKGLLEFLVLEKAAVLRESIAALDPFPDEPVFTDCRKMHQKLKYSKGKFTLKQEVEHFLCLSHEHDAAPEFRLEGLKFLNEKLAQEAVEIGSLVEGDLLSRLICELVHLTKCQDQQVSLEAGKCLGSLGPVNLNTLSLPWRQNSPGLEVALQSFQEVTDVQKYCYIFHLLNKYLTDQSIETVGCASEVLKLMLSVKTGMEFSQGYRAQLGETEYLFHYLHPFRSPRKKPIQIPGPSRSWDVFQATVDQELLWNPRNVNYGDWVSSLTEKLIQSGSVKDELLRLLEPICKRKVEFCETVLPYIIHDILLSGSEEHREVLSRQIDNFFACHCGHTTGRISRCQSTLSASIQLDHGEEYMCMNVKAVRILLDVIQYLRQQTRPKQGRSTMTPWDNNFWLDVNYLQMAKAAQYCSAHFSTVLLAEIWCDIQRDQSETSQSHSSSRGSRSRHSQDTLSQNLSDDTRLDTLSDSSAGPSGVSVKDLLYEAYRRIGDPDGVYGCGADRQADATSRIRQYQHENKWDKAVITCDIQMNQSDVVDQSDVVQALQNFGCSHILDTYMQGMMGDISCISPVTRELQYEAAWKMGQWNLDTPNRLSEDAGFNQSVFSSLKAIKEDHYSFAIQAVEKARLCCLKGLQESSMESSRTLFPVLANLQCVSILDHVSSARQVDSSFPVFTSGQDVDFEFTLPALTMSCSSLDMLYLKSSRKEILTQLVKQFQGLSQQARLAGRHQIAERAIRKLSSLDISDLDLQIPTQIEEARLYWSRSEENIAKHLMRNLIDRLRKMKSANPIAARFYPQALSIYGNWLADTRSENPNVIMEKYLEKTVKLLERLGEDQDTALEAYLSLARYADTQYQNIVTYMKSSTFEAKQSLLKKAQEEMEKLREVMGESAKDRYLRTLEKQSDIDQQELESMLEDRNKFLLKAVENYIKCLKCGDQHNLRVFRLTSLWFSNAGVEEVNTMIEGAVESMGSYKWLPLIYQLAARMDVKPQRETSSKFLPTLNKIIADTAVTHPHHTLFCVIALANANRDTELLQQAKPSSKRSSKLSKSQADSTGEQEGRVQAAKNMVEKLRQDAHVGVFVKEMEVLCDAFIQLANWNVSQYKTETKPIQLPSALWISKIKDLKHVPVPTAEIKVDPTGNYSEIPYIIKFEPTFKLAGGINLPKIISCHGSDGKKSRQLVKGKDDLRQDAVMQQVFGMVNNLLQKNSETRKRQLQIRKYKMLESKKLIIPNCAYMHKDKVQLRQGCIHLTMSMDSRQVIPLSQRSGLLEWCEGTQPIGEYLIGSPGGAVKGAHTRYRPQDWPSYQCRNHLQSGTSLESKYKVYQEICANFRPVFRHFFLERFSKPAVWFERRLAYTRSVATNSIVGYILGLGDRHVQNILVDCNTAELVHIDLGVAFEQGKILPTPETVPFRLTRDIEDGMGVSGVEGVFRRCCEKTMEVMRNNQEALLTILEVLLYDPLYAWTISPAKAYALQQRRDRNDAADTLDIANTTGDLIDLAESSSRTNSETQENVNKLAERVLLRLQQKLQGVEDGVQLSLSGQVNHLIQEARNPKNLARLFPGWQPFI